MQPILRWTEDGLDILNQQLLPGEVVYRRCNHVADVADAIVTLQVRGAPAIGITAAFGVVLAVWRDAPKEVGPYLAAVKSAAELLRSTRPTAVNLFWALNRMEAEAMRQVERGPERITPYLLKEAQSIMAEDIAMNQALGAFGAPLIPDGANVLTHCNAGALATGGHGTALGVIRSAIGQKKRLHVWVDETRPALQGARLTAWELRQDNIPCTLITDSMAGSLMARGQVDAVIVGADRIAANGDVANKIGTYSVAVLAHHHGIPFWVAAPSSTIDMATPDGGAITIEERNPDEVRFCGACRTAPEGMPVYNPSFDVTPARYITGVITDRGVIHPPYRDALAGVFGTKG